MKRNSIIVIFFLLFFLLLAGYIWIYKSEKSFLTIHLRCDDNISGYLSITTHLRNNNIDTYDLKEACSKEKVLLKPYLKEQTVFIKVKLKELEGIKGIKINHMEIQSDPNGIYYTILRIRSSSPFISFEKI